MIVHQMGWRLGGKLASSRNRRKGHRNEEHGLHVWFGFYENAFALMREVYDAWEPPPGCPLTDFDSAFLPHSYTPIGFRSADGKAHPHDVTWPVNEDEPGRGQVRMTPWGAVTQLLSLCRRAIEALIDKPLGDRAWTPSAGALRAMSRLQARGRNLGDRPTDLGAWRGLLKLLDKALDRRARVLTSRNVDEHPVIALLDLILALLTAMVDPDEGVAHDWDFDRWNHMELRELLKKHGGHPAVVDHWSGLRMIYDSTFQYRQGDPKQPDMAAGTGARVVLRTMTTYKGSVLYHLAAGAGETFISPLYEVLKDRGVRFELFHDVRELTCSDARVDSVRIAVQADAPDYRPTFVHRGLVVWPEEPFWDQLGGKLPGDFERRWNKPEPVEELVLRDGPDYDELVLAIPLGAIRERKLADELRVHAPFARMLDAPSLVPTAAAQLWMDESLLELGWIRPRPALVGWTYPLSIWADMTHVLEHEDTPESGSYGSLHYLCGTLNTDLYTSEDSPRQKLGVQARVAIRRQLARNPLWPDPARPRDWMVRVNIDPSACVVGSAAGAVQQRLAADESGFANLWLAGAWTKNGIDASSVEAAVMSGKQAARGILGEPLRVPGEHFMRRG